MKTKRRPAIDRRFGERRKNRQGQIMEYIHSSGGNVAVCCVPTGELEIIRKKDWERLKP